MKPWAMLLALVLALRPGLEGATACPWGPAVSPLDPHLEPDPSPAPPQKARKAPPRKGVPKKPAPRKPAPKKVAPKPTRADILEPQRLAPFFQALEALEKDPASPRVDILFFGDSHTAADLLTSRVRSRLQTHFGDGGPGLLLPGLPWRGHPHPGLRHPAPKTWTGDCLRREETPGKVGLPGTSPDIPPGEAWLVSAPFREATLTVLGGPEAPELRVEIPGTEVQPPNPELVTTTELPSGTLRTFRFSTPEPAPGLAISLAPPATLLGLDLAGTSTGVRLHELGLNGGQLVDLARWDAALRAQLLVQARPALMIFAYGTNEARRSSLDPAALRTETATLLAQMRKEAGDAPILVVGPPDQASRRRRGAAALKAAQGPVRDALREAAHEAGAAFWDARVAMGGAGSIQKWRKAGWVQRDLVHLSRPGYERLGDLLCEALLRAYLDSRSPR